MCMMMVNEDERYIYKNKRKLTVNRLLFDQIFLYRDH